MMFNGNDIYFNNHSVTFKNFVFQTNKINSKYYYLAYDTSCVKDKGVINFINSHLSLYEDHNYVEKDVDNKIEINFN